jgi:hypothetical protein
MLSFEVTNPSKRADSSFPSMGCDFGPKGGHARDHHCTLALDDTERKRLVPLPASAYPSRRPMCQFQRSNYGRVLEKFFSSQSFFIDST